MAQHKEIRDKENAQNALLKVYQDARLSFLERKNPRSYPIPSIDESDVEAHKEATDIF